MTSRKKHICLVLMMIIMISHTLGEQEDKMISIVSSNSSMGPKSVERLSQNSTIAKVRATLGREATIRCEARNLVGQKTVSWVRYSDTSLIAVGKFVYISDHRFKVLHEKHSTEWFLVIKAVTYDDQGIYECQVNSDPYKTFKFHLSVVEPRTEILGDQERFVDSTSSLNLTCLVISPNPPAYIFWKLTDKLVDVTEWSKSDNQSNVRLMFNQHWRPGVTVSSLFIQRVNKSHNGIFQCSPSNSEAKTIKVHVLKGNLKPAAIQKNQKVSSNTSPHLFPGVFAYVTFSTVWTMWQIPILIHFHSH